MEKNSNTKPSDKVLYLVRGLPWPGSGKSTFAKKLVDVDFLICEADKYFIDKTTGEYKFDPTKLKEAHKWCQEQVETYMKDSSSHPMLGFYKEIVVSNTFTQKWEMDPYFEMAQKYGYKTFVMVIENYHGGKNTHGVPEDKLEVMRNRFEFKL